MSMEDIPVSTNSIMLQTTAPLRNTHGWEGDEIKTIRLPLTVENGKHKIQTTYVRSCL